MPDEPCTLTGPGGFYNLLPLKSNSDYTFKTPTGQPVLLNICNTLHNDPWNMRATNPALVAGSVRKERGDFAMGEVNMTLTFSPTSPAYPRLVYTNGSPCRGGEIKASTIIDFICDISAPPPSSSDINASPSVSAHGPHVVGQFPPSDGDSACAYYIQWRTPHACPVSTSVFQSWIAFFLLILLLPPALYLLLGTLYNTLILHLRGSDAIPKFSLTAARYHAGEMWDLGKDWWEEATRAPQRNYDMPGSARFDDEDQTPVPTPGGGPHINPVSHQNTILSPNNGKGFVRPARTPSNSNSTTNPVSHQTQLMSGGVGNTADGLSANNAGPNRREFVSHVTASQTIPNRAPELPSQPAQLFTAAQQTQLAQQQMNPITPGPASSRPFQLGDDESDVEESEMAPYQDGEGTPTSTTMGGFVRPVPGAASGGGGSNIKL